MRAIILAAGCGNRLNGFFEDPKCLLPVGGTPLLGRYLQGLEAIGVEEVLLVLGYKMEKVTAYIETLSTGLSVTVLENKAFEKGSILSLWTARQWLDGDILLMDGDVYFETEVLLRAAASDQPNFFLLDPGAKNDGEAVIVGFQDQKAVALARGLQGDFSVSGEWAGAIRLSKEGASLLKDIACREVARGNTHKGYEFEVPQLFDRIDIAYELINGLKWIEIDYPQDFHQAQVLAAGQPASTQGN